MQKASFRKDDLLDKMANILLEQEVINHEEIKQILGKNLKQ
jgi:ATP-dependent Zn protease